MLNRPMTAIDQQPTSGEQPALDEIGRHVHVDEGEVEAADEEADHQQPVAAMAPGRDSACMNGRSAWPAGCSAGRAGHRSAG